MTLLELLEKINVTKAEDIKSIAPKKYANTYLSQLDLR